MAEINTRMGNSPIGAYTHTVTATDISDGSITVDFEVGMPLAGIVQATTVTGVILDPATAILTYPAEGKMKFEPSAGGVKEVSTITTIADDSDSLDGTYFVLQDEAGSVGFWFDVDNSGTTVPTTGADRDVEVTTVTTDMTAIAVAGVLATAINTDSKFVAPATATDVVTITSSTFGAKLDPVDGDSGFTFAVTTQGVTVESEGNLMLELGNKVTFLAFRDIAQRNTYSDLD